LLSHDPSTMVKKAINASCIIVFMAPLNIRYFQIYGNSDLSKMTNIRNDYFLKHFTVKCRRLFTPLLTHNSQGHQGNGHYLYHSAGYEGNYRFRKTITIIKK
jgi:hypothetical protein